MAGHSKWNNIKQRKGAMDAKRGKEFSKIAKLIRAAVKEGKSGDPKQNPTLRTILDKARAANMPKKNIDRAIERGLGKSASGAAIQEIVYEGFGPGGVACMVVALTDNPNRTSADMKYAFGKAGGSLGGPGSAQYMFKRSDSGDYVATMPMDIDESTQKQLSVMIDTLRENDDVEDVYCAVDLDALDAGVSA